MTWKLVTLIWNPWARVGLATMATLWATLLPWMDGPDISLWLMLAAAILIGDLLIDGSKKSLQPLPTKSCTTLPTMPGGYMRVDSPSMVESLIRCSPRPSSTKTVSRTASIRLASTTSKKSNRNKVSSKRLRTSVCIPRKSSGNSLRCMLANTPKAMPN